MSSIPTTVKQNFQPVRCGYHQHTSQPEYITPQNIHFNLFKNCLAVIFFCFKERQIQNHGTSNTNYLTQMAKVENQCKDIFKQCSQVLATVDKVEANSKFLHDDSRSSVVWNNKAQFTKTEDKYCTLCTSGHN